MVHWSELGQHEKFEEIKELIKNQNSSESLQETTNRVLEIVQDLQTKLVQQNKLITKIVAYVLKLYQDGEINKDTFNKLDDFLKPYYDQPYVDED